MYLQKTGTATFTDVLRKPKEVLARIDEGQVRITRRVGDDLVILRAHDLDALVDGVALTSRLIRAIGRNRGDAGAAISDLFAWTRELSPAGLAAYAAEMGKLAFAAVELGSFEHLLRAQKEWEETARAYATGMRPVGRIETQAAPVLVDRPSADLRPGRTPRWPIAQVAKFPGQCAPRFR